ncbi:MAG: Iojap-related protein [Acidobacteria bacterium]|jgi:ribosome-associated protein|nr:Iojap-related protein [Acidobacteriota bacterium]
MKEALRLALTAFEDKKAFDIVLLDISKVASFASYFLMCSGDSSRQIQAIADEVEKKLKENGIRPNHVEGYRHAEWILMDYVDIVVHVFSKSARAYYDLERLWRDGKRLDAQKVLNAKTRKTPASARR